MKYMTGICRDTTFGQFEKATWKKVEEAEEYVQWLNSAPERIRAETQKIISYSDDRYIINTGVTYKVDRNMAKHEIVNWKTVSGIYTAGNTVEDAIRNQGMEITNSDSYSEPKTEAVFSQRAKFKDLFERYCKIRDNEPQICFRPSTERVLIETKNPLVKEAYEKIGADEVRKMKYHQSNIKRRLIAESQKNFCGQGGGDARHCTEEADMDSVSQSEIGTPEDIRQSRNQEDGKGN